MAPFFQAAAAVLLTSILILTLEQKTLGAALSMGVCAMVLLIGLEYMKPVIEFIRELEDLGGFQGEVVGILLKITGISLITRIAALTCADSGNASLAQGLKLVGNAVTLWLSIPIFRTLMDLVQRILEGGS